MAERTITYRVTAATQGFQAGMAQAAGSAQQGASRIGSAMQRNRQALTAAGTAAVGFGAAVGIGIGRAVAAGAEFESKMNQVRAVSGATGQEFEQLSGVAREMGRSTMFGASEAAEGLSFLSMAGFEAQESVEALPGVLDLAAAGQMELGRSADIASNVLQGFGLAADETMRVVDTMAATFTASNTSLEQMGRSLSFVAPVANSAGLELEETAAAIGLMGDAGIQGSRAGTAMRQSIARLLRPVGQAKEVIGELGLSVSTSDGELLSLVDIMGQLEDAGANTADVVGLFGQEAGPAMAALLDRGSGALEDFAVDLENSGGTAKEVADTQMEGLRGSLVELGSAFEGLQIRIAESGLLGSLESVTDATSGVIRVMEGLPDGVVRVGTTAVSVASGLSLLGGAAALAGPRIADMASHLGGFGRVAMRGGVIVGLTTAVIELGREFQSARAAGEEMIDSIIEDAPNAEAAIRDVRDAQEEHVDQSHDLSSSARRMGNALLGPIGAWWNAKDALEDSGLALELWGAEADVAAGFAEENAAGFRDWADAADPLGVTLGSTAGNIREAAEAADDAGDSTDGAGAASQRYADVLADMNGDLDDTATKADRLSDAWDRLFGQTISAERATIDARTAIAELDGQLEDNARTLDTNTEAGRANASALLDGVEHARTLADAQLEAGASTDDAAAAAQGHVDDLVDEMEQIGFTRAEIEGYLQQLGFVPDEVGTTVVAEVDGALEALNDVERALAGVHARAQAGVNFRGTGRGPAEIRHSGGEVGSGGPTRPLSAGLASNERHVIAEVGEMVITADQRRALEGPAGGSFVAPSGGQPIIARGGEPIASPPAARSDGGGSQVVDRSVKVGQVVAHDYDDFLAQMSQRQRVGALQGGRR